MGRANVLYVKLLASRRSHFFLCPAPARRRLSAGWELPVPIIPKQHLVLPRQCPQTRVTVASTSHMKGVRARAGRQRTCITHFARSTADLSHRTSPSTIAAQAARPTFFFCSRSCLSLPLPLAEACPPDKDGYCIQCRFPEALPKFCSLLSDGCSSLQATVMDESCND